MGKGEKTLEYRPAYRKLYFIALWFNLLIVIAIVYLHIGQFLSDTLDVALTRLFVVLALPLFFFLYLFLFIRPKLKSRYWLNPSSLLIDDLKGERELAFKNIVKITLSRISPLSRFKDGFRFKLESGGIYKLTSSLAGNFLIFAAIAKERPDLISNRLLMYYSRFSMMMDLSWERTRRKLELWPIIGFKYLILPVLFSRIWCAIRWTQVPNDYYDQLLTVFLGHLAWVGLWGLFFNFVEETLLIQLYGRYAKPNGELPQSIETFLGYGVQASFYLFCFGSYYWIFFKK